MITYGTPASVRDLGGMRAAMLSNPQLNVHPNANQMSFPGLTPRPQVPPSFVTGPNPGVPLAQPGQGSLNFNPGSMQRSAAFDAMRAAAAAPSSFVSRLLGGVRALASPAAAAAMVAPAAFAEMQRIGDQPRGVRRPMRYLPQATPTTAYVPDLFGAPASAPQQRPNVLLPETQARLDAAYAVPRASSPKPAYIRTAPIPQVSSAEMQDLLEAQIMAAHQAAMQAYTPDGNAGESEAYRAMQPMQAPVVTPTPNPLAAQGDYAHGDMANGWVWNANTWSWERP
jgi:hypothetical protein